MAARAYRWLASGAGSDDYRISMGFASERVHGIANSSWMGLAPDTTAARLWRSGPGSASRCPAHARRNWLIRGDTAAARTVWSAVDLCWRSGAGVLRRKRAREI